MLGIIQQSHRMIKHSNQLVTITPRPKNPNPKSKSHEIAIFLYWNSSEIALGSKHLQENKSNTKTRGIGWF